MKTVNHDSLTNKTPEVVFSNIALKKNNSHFSQRHRVRLLSDLMTIVYTVIIEFEVSISLIYRLVDIVYRTMEALMRRCVVWLV